MQILIREHCRTEKSDNKFKSKSERGFKKRKKGEIESKSRANKNVEKWHNYGLLWAPFRAYKNSCLWCCHCWGMVQVNSPLMVPGPVAVITTHLSSHLASHPNLTHLCNSCSNTCISSIIWLHNPKFLSKLRLCLNQSFIHSSSILIHTWDHIHTSCPVSILLTNEEN